MTNTTISETHILICLLVQHRHPLIERLGLLYLLKLYNGKSFGTQAGGQWRILFVLALMPWMRNYRVQSSQGLLLDNQDGDDRDGAITLHEQIQSEMEKRGAKGGTDDVVGMKLELALTRRAYNTLNKRNQELMRALTIAQKKIKEVKADRKEMKRQLNASQSHTSPESAEFDEGPVEV